MPKYPEKNQKNKKTKTNKQTNKKNGKKRKKEGIREKKGVLIDLLTGFNVAFIHLWRLF